MIQSKRGKLNIADLTKGFVTAVLSGATGFLLQALSTGTIPTDPKLILVFALAGGLGYLQKNLFTNSEGKLDKEPEPPRL